MWTLGHVRRRGVHGRDRRPVTGGLAPSRVRAKLALCIALQTPWRPSLVRPRVRRCCGVTFAEHWRRPTLQSSVGPSDVACAPALPHHCRNGGPRVGCGAGLDAAQLRRARAGAAGWRCAAKRCTTQLPSPASPGPIRGARHSRCQPASGKGSGLVLACAPRGRVHQTRLPSFENTPRSNSSCAPVAWTLTRVVPAPQLPYATASSWHCWPVPPLVRSQTRVFPAPEPGAPWRICKHRLPNALSSSSFAETYLPNGGSGTWTLRRTRGAPLAPRSRPCPPSSLRSELQRWRRCC